MPRPMSGLERDRRRIKRCKLAAVGVKGELQHLVGAENGGIDEAVGAVRQDRMGIAAGRQHLDWFGRDEPVLVDGTDGDLVASVGRGEQKAATAIGRDIRHTVRQRSRRLLRQRAALAVDRVSEHAHRLRADHGVEKPLVGRHCHRHHGLARLGPADRGQRAGLRIHDVSIDRGVDGIGHIDEGRGLRHRGHSDRQQGRKRSARERRHRCQRMCSLAHPFDYLLLRTLCQAGLERSKSFGPGRRFGRRPAEATSAGAG